MPPPKLKTFFLEIALFSYNKNGYPCDDDLFFRDCFTLEHVIMAPLTSLAPGPSFCKAITDYSNHSSKFESPFLI